MRKVWFTDRSGQSTSLSSLAVCEPALEHRVHLLDAPLVQADPLRDQPAVVGDVLAVARLQQGEVVRRRPLQRRHVGLQRRGPARRVGIARHGTVHEWVRRDVRDQVVADERHAGRVVAEDRVGGAVPGPQSHAQPQVADLEHVAVGERAVDVRARTSVRPPRAHDREERPRGARAACRATGAGLPPTPPRRPSPPGRRARSRRGARGRRRSTRSARRSSPRGRGGRSAGG